ncbi:MAG: site-specific integrase [Acidobacteriota bacterium]|nr:site-specific integrase [Acidobacteriota bacterium]
MRALVVGSVKQYPTETAAWKAVSTLRLDVNHHTSRPEGLPETFEQLAEHYRLIELDLEKTSERKVYQTKQTYGIYLKARIVPRWGGYRIREIKAVAVERWLGSIDDLSNGTKAKIKGIMSEVFQHAIRYGWLNDGENPIFAVRQSTKRVRVTEPLEAAEFRALMLELQQKMRIIGIVAATTGLRISEVLGLKWMDIDWKTLQMEVTRSVVDGIVGKCKTETSRRPVPIDEFITAELLAWKQETCYAAPEDWVFASEKVQGRMPPWADTLLDRFLQPAAKRAGITKWVGFHTFRHTYSTLLKANGEDVKVVQELMRHANIATTMIVYTKALTPAKREAQSRVVDVLLDRSRNVESAAEHAA